jgi:putative transposase
MKDLDALIESNPDPRELKRGLAVKMSIEGYKHREISKILRVSSGFISKWKQEYLLQAAEGLKLKHQGSKGYLSEKEKQEVLLWLEKKNDWNLNELEYYLASEFDVIFAARSSYYDLFHHAGISWKKSQKKNPGKDPKAVAEKKRRLSNF